MNKSTRKNTINRELMGKRIRSERLDRGLTQEVFAERIDCSSVFLAELEGGKKLMSLENIYYMALVTGISIDYILDLDDEYSEEEDLNRKHMIRDINESLRSLGTENLKIAYSVVKALTGAIKAKLDE